MKQHFGVYAAPEDGLTYQTHTDGYLLPIPHVTKAGFDVLNPIQWTIEMRNG